MRSTRLLVAHGRAGRTVVRLKGGDPFLFGRGGEEAEALTRAAVAWEVVPGVTSAMAVPAYAGIPVTHRGLSTSVTVVTGHVGDPSAPGGVDWESLARAGGTLVILMGMATRAEIARRLQAGGRPADTPVAVVQWGTTPSQRSVRTTLGGLESVTLGSPSVIVVGPVAALDLAWFAERPLAGTTVVVTRAREQAGTLAGAFDAAGARVVEVPVVEIADPEDGGVALRRCGGRSRRLRLGGLHLGQRRAPLRPAPAGRPVARLGAPGRGGRRHRRRAGRPPPGGRSGGRRRSRSGHRGGPGGGLPRGSGGGAGALPPGRRGPPDAPRGLAAKGWEVDEVVAYRTPARRPRRARWWPSWPGPRW